jgi:hypothetical protein
MYIMRVSQWGWVSARALLSQGGVVGVQAHTGDLRDGQIMEGLAIGNPFLGLNLAP